MIDAIAWAVAAALAVVIASFCGCELRWKAKRLRRDLGDLLGTVDELRRVQAQLVATADRLVAVTARPRTADRG